MNYVLTGVGHTISVAILAGHYEECESGMIEHRLEARCGADSAHSLGVEFVAFDAQPLSPETLQRKPDA